MNFEQIRIVLVEDEEIWSKSITSSLRNFGFTVAALADNFEDAVTLLTNQDFDIALIDININQKNTGIELGRLVHNLLKKPFIFITANTDNATLNDAILALPSAYLTKPVHPASLVATIHGAILNFLNNSTPSFNHAPTSTHELFFVKHGKKYIKINWNNVVYLRSEKSYTILFNELDKTEYYIRSTLSKVMQYLIPYTISKQFIQINRAEAVQISFINEVKESEIITQIKTFVLTESYSANFRNAIKVIT